MSFELSPRYLAAGAAAMIGLTSLEGCGIVGAVLPGDSAPESVCHNYLKGRNDLTISRHAAIRSENHREDDPQTYLLDRNGKKVSFEAGNRHDTVAVCVSENSSTWYGFDSGELAKLTHTNLSEDDNGWAWVNQTNVTITQSK